MRTYSTKSNRSYVPIRFNRAGTKLVRKWYGERAARSYNA